MGTHRWRIELAGRLQGVGFRPLVHRLAKALDLSGSVWNEGQGVVVEVQGPECELEHFIRDLHAQLPGHACIDEQRIIQLPAIDYQGTKSDGFKIQSSGGPIVWACEALPDLPPCQACLSELFDPENRRYLYPMISCTQCGPRFSIQRSAPFDRQRTTLEHYLLCQDCQSEYDDTHNRRCHAQTLGCFSCGPQWVWTESPNAPLICNNSKSVQTMLDAFVRILRTDGIVVVKGVGGYQFFCDAASERAVKRIRQIKHREAKPFAVLVDSMDRAKELVELSLSGIEALQGSDRPIVIGNRRKAKSTIEPEDYPGNWVCSLRNSLGVMLPNSPAQYLLASAFGRPCLVTSANDSNEPMLIDDRQVIERFGGRVQAVLMHDREIAEPLDDPVICDTPVGLIPVRLGRGNTPCRLSNPSNRECDRVSLALGADLKSAWALALGNRVYLTQHLGAASHPAVASRIEQSIGRLLATGLPLEGLITDKHPEYQTTLLGQRLALLCQESANQVTCKEVQHHVAHLGSLMLDHGILPEAPFIGFVFDGTGLGSDGSIWGGELIGIQNYQSHRLGYLRPFRLPLGDVAAKNPWRAALALMIDAGITPESIEACCAWASESGWGKLSKTEQFALQRASTSQILTIPSSSMGRFIDGLTSLLGLTHINDYEGHAAMLLEDLAAHEHRQIDAQSGTELNSKLDSEAYRFAFTEVAGRIVFDGRDVVRGVLKDLREQVAVSRIAYRIHLSIAILMRDSLMLVPAAWSESRRVGITGGVFQNRLLTELTAQKFQESSWRVVMHQRVPPNDSGLAVGQLLFS
jgi:hydrogenase maturation protein HypF